jgi:hypothetical protein
MKQISTGTGLCVLGMGIAVLGAAQLVGSKGGQAFAQTGSERRIVSASVNSVGESNYATHYAYRIWSDNTIEMRNLGVSLSTDSTARLWVQTTGNFLGWTQVDNGLTAFVPADVDASQTVDASDLGNVLLNYGETQNGNPPPPIDCTINAPR